MANIGFSELVVILMILVLVFGASRLPQLGESLGKTVRNVKRGFSDDEADAAKKQIADGVSVGGTGKTASNVTDAELVQDSSDKPKA